MMNRRRLFFIFLVCLSISCTHAQEAKTFNFYDSIKYYDLSTLWRADSVLNLSMVDDTFYRDPKYFLFPEPLGFIGHDYQRFYIHLASVKKNWEDPYTYYVTGKTRVKNIICKFEGVIKIDSARYFVDSNVRNIKRGSLYCTCIFREDKNMPESGCLTGMLVTDWCIVNGHIYYDNIEGIADGYCNNQFTGKWKRYKDNIVKKCNWGDERIPDWGDLDIGAGEFSVNDKYLKNGWQSLRDAYIGGDTIKAKKALAKENEKWWK